MKMVHVDRESLATSLTTALVDASVDECAAYEFSLDSREHIKKATERGLTHRYVKHSSEHTCYLITTRELGFFLNPREGRSKITWMKVDGKIVMDVSDTKDVADEDPSKEGNVLVSAHAVWIFERLDPVGEIPQTAVTFTT
eukprot:CAMPEP_0118632396 /NCGR_PEP_ID=MMETSP0785-20121206/424_1 /TAXON_ID=91992 /ORGANISM="Bolidomonas pacifica, Strain CCMP 1866" /LENGTH=140 /DNA_ID=CAMNT_0006523167 /DNA_START=522 /DNA_END=941 /DNA_ORIENTATION=-